jgi:hypothetical protein
MEPKPKLFEKFNSIMIVNKSWNLTPNLVSIVFNDRTEEWFPPDSNNWILTIKFWVHLDPEPGLCKWALQVTWPTLVVRGGGHSKLEPIKCNS